MESPDPEVRPAKRQREDPEGAQPPDEFRLGISIGEATEERTFPRSRMIPQVAELFDRARKSRGPEALLKVTLVGPKVGNLTVIQATDDPDGEELEDTIYRVLDASKLVSRRAYAISRYSSLPAIVRNLAANKRAEEKLKGETLATFHAAWDALEPEVREIIEAWIAVTTPGTRRSAPLLSLDDDDSDSDSDGREEVDVSVHKPGEHSTGVFIGSHEGGQVICHCLETFSVEDWMVHAGYVKRTATQWRSKITRSDGSPLY